MSNHKVDITGKRFGRLVAIESFYNKDKKATFWKCICDCGKEKNIRYKDLNYGSCKSCGCYRDEVLKECNKKPKGESALNSLFHSYKVGAKTRNLEFNLTKPEFKYLTKCHCFYCGISPSNEYSTKGCNGSYIYSGIDRLDSNKGYHKKNCVPACKQCNLAKSSMSYEDFNIWIDRLTSFKSSGQNILVNDQSAPENLDDSPCVFNMVMEDLQDRANQGIKKYGMPLKTNNKRNSLIDAYQEVLDLSLYLRQHIEEHNMSDYGSESEECTCDTGSGSENRKCRYCRSKE